MVTVVDMHLAGFTMREIADHMNRLGMPTPGGGQHWYASHVHRLLHTRGAKNLIGDRKHLAVLLDLPRYRRRMAAPSSAE